MSGMIFVQIEFKTDDEEKAMGYLKEWKKQGIIVNSGFVHPNMNSGHCMD